MPPKKRESASSTKNCKYQFASSDLASEHSSPFVVRAMRDKSTRRFTRTPTDRLSVLRAIEFRSYKHDITVYQYSHQLLPLHAFWEQLKLTRSKHGFIDRRDSGLNGNDIPIPSLSELPYGRTEVVYVPQVFRVSTRAGVGSALGFLMDELIVWLTFDGPIHNFLEAWTVSDSGYIATDKPVPKITLNSKGHYSKVVESGHATDSSSTTTKLFTRIRVINDGNYRSRSSLGKNPEHRLLHDLVFTSNVAQESTANGLFWPLPRFQPADVQQKQLDGIKKAWKRFLDVGYTVEEFGYHTAMEGLIVSGASGEDSEQGEDIEDDEDTN